MTDIRRVNKIEEVNINIDYFNLNNKQQNNTKERRFYSEFQKELEEAKKNIKIRKRENKNSK